MNDSKRLAFSLWNLLSPILVSVVVMNLLTSLFAVLAVFWGTDPKEQYMMLQAAATAATIPVIAGYYRKDQAQPTMFWERMHLILEKKSVVQRTVTGFFMFLTGAVLGIALNNMILLTNLQESSPGYQKINSYFFAGGILFELLGACLLTPFLEELLYRGVVYGRLCDLMILQNRQNTERGGRRERQSRIIAMAGSAFLFGILHMNLVQFIYAGLLGFLFAWFMEKAGHIYGAFLAHTGANLMAVLRVRTSLFSGMEQGSADFYAVTAVFFAAGVLLILAIAFMFARQNQKSMAEEG
ncbi:CPBP family intramembrane metalloprotease [Lachnospiraceae bacterium]|nr:CPBP family intramembrane metalloprotease [Lachnospiraceae bacterium]